MPRPIGLLTDDGIEHPMMRRVVLPARVAASGRPALVAGLLSVLVGVVLAWGLAFGHASWSAPGARSAGVSRGGLSSLPVAARGPVSAALGSADPRYRVSASKGGFEAVNPGQRLRVRFGRSGIALSSGGERLALSLDGVGYGGSLRPAGDVLSHAEGNRVVYTGDGLSEWYANGPLGLEQGFTVSRAPTGPRSGPLTLSMALSGDARAALANGGKSVVLSGRGSSLSYGGLVASDARGRALRSWLVLRDGQILLRVDTRGARYPLRIDPTLALQEELTGVGEEQGEGRFGTSVALSADGDTALVGAPNDEEGVGAVWVFTREGAIWKQQGRKLTGGDLGGTGVTECEIEEPGEEEEAGECGFGASVALSANGDTALVGGSGINGNVGAVWVFVREVTTEGTIWARQEILTGWDREAKDHFGKSVAISGDGDTALIGAPGAAGYKGAAWVFTRAGTEWSEQAKLSGSESGVIHFGRSVALSDDGATALVGAPGAAGHAGAAWVFVRSEGTVSTWSEQEKLTGSEESGEGHFGFSVALSTHGATALVGERAGQGNTGAAWAFTREGASGSKEQKLTAGGEGGDAKFGYSVALSGDGDTALIGSPSCIAPHDCPAWVFTRPGSASTFGLDATLEASGGGRFGTGVALSANGETALLGAPMNGKRLGAAWSFVKPGSPPVVTGVNPTEGPTEGGTIVTISGSDFAEATAVDFGKVPAGKFTVNSEGTSITAESPKEKAGTVDVTVSGPEVASATSEHDQFTFVAPVKKGGGGKEPGPEPKLNPELKPEPEPKPNVTGGNGAVGGTGNGAVLAFGPTTKASAACGVSLRGRRIAVRRRGRAVLKLVWKKGKGSAATCRGRLTLQVKVTAKAKVSRKRRFRTKTIGTASFTIAPGGTKVVTIKLNAAGRSRLRAAHGSLAARLTILVSSPAPRRTQARVVVLRASRPRRSVK
jgi:IPT/TIG domain/FG-GAP repeat